MHQRRRRVFLSAEWRYLLMLNFEVPPPLLQPLVPAGTTLDLWQGKALVSVVGFRFLQTRVLGMPVPGHRNFDEINLRFYIRRALPDGQVRRGVAFVRELVPRLMIARLAKLAYNEPYSSCRMRSIAPTSPIDSPGRIEYAWRHHGGWNSLSARAIGEAMIPPPEAESAFITEHYWGYTRQRSSLTVEYQVEHPQWKLWDVKDAQLTPGAAAFYGPVFESYLSVGPRSAFLAAGSPVLVFKPTLLSFRGMTARAVQLQTMLERTPDDPFLQYAMAMEEKNAGDLSAALARFENVITLDVSYCYAYFQLGQTHEVAGDLVAANVAYERGILAARTKGDAHALSELEGALSML